MVKIFVGNIHDPAPDFEMQLRSAFEKYGTVTDCRLISNYAFVHMESEDAANKAISGLHKTMLGNSRVNVEPGRPDRSRGPPGSDRRGGIRGGGGGVGGGGGTGGQLAYMPNFAYRSQGGTAAFLQQTQPTYGLTGYGFQQQQPLLAYGLQQRGPVDMVATSMDSLVANGGDGLGASLIDAGTGGRQKRYAADNSGLGGLGGGTGGQPGGDGKMPRLDYDPQQQQQQQAAFYPNYADLLAYGQNYGTTSTAMYGGGTSAGASMEAYGGYTGDAYGYGQTAAAYNPAASVAPTSIYGGVSYAPSSYGVGANGADPTVAYQQAQQQQQQQQQQHLQPSSQPQAYSASAAYTSTASAYATPAAYSHYATGGLAGATPGAQQMYGGAAPAAMYGAASGAALPQAASMPGGYSATGSVHPG